MSTTPFHVLAKPIGALCNLRCEYCFYLDKSSLYPRSKFRMSDAVLETHVRNYITSQPAGVREINFAWQGGEPTLLGLDFFRQAVELQNRYAPSGVTITNALQTNGTRLDEEWCRFLRENHFLVGISIDGPPGRHNRYRKTKGGLGSFAQVKRGLDHLIAQDVDFNVLTVVQRDNGDHPKEVYEALKELGARFLQFIPIVERRGVQDVSERSVLPDQFGRFLIDLFESWRTADIGQVFVQHFDTALSAIMGNPWTLCVHAPRCGRAAVLEHNGDVYACDHFVTGEYLLGNIRETSYAEMIDGGFQSAFGAAKQQDLPPKCTRCRVRSLCHGGCPGHRFLEVRGSPFKLNYLCEGYRAFFTHIEPYLKAMQRALLAGEEARAYIRYADIPRARPGRNDPCPCGSGKKYKHCCGR